MGSNQSVRSTHFQPPDEAEPDHTEEVPEERLISISNKMVERLVEDATLAVDAAETQVISTPRGDFKDKLYMERLRCMDESHSERTGLTVPAMHALANRIELRTANMVSGEPVCSDFEEKIIECYNTCQLPEDGIKCWDIVGEFSNCVKAAGVTRLRARTEREAREHARRSRHMALARQHELRDLGPRVREESIPA